MPNNNEIEVSVVEEKTDGVFKRIDQIRGEITLHQDQKYQTLAMAGYADNLPWDKKRYIKAANEALQDHVLKGIEVGRRLLVLKEMLPHGEFIPALEEIGIAESTAKRYMRVAFHFAGLGDETKELLGMNKLYKLLQAPVEQIARLQDDGELFDMSKDQLIAMSAKELDARIKESVAKKQLDIDQERLKSNALFEECKTLQKENERLQKDLTAAITGEPPKDPLPSWWNEYSDALHHLTDLALKLASDKPNLQDETINRRCERCWAALNLEFDRARRYLQALAVDPIQSKFAIAEKMSEIKAKNSFNLQALEENE